MRNAGKRIRGGWIFHNSNGEIYMEFYRMVQTGTCSPTGKGWS
jgi:hypothetical protein